MTDDDEPDIWRLLLILATIAVVLITAHTAHAATPDRDWRWPDYQHQPRYMPRPRAVPPAEPVRIYERPRRKYFLTENAR